MLAQRQITVLGVRVQNYSYPEALDYVSELIEKPYRRTHNLFIVNAHTVNLASEDESVRNTLNSADIVFADGTGVRWAARLRGVRLKANLVGTDLVPAILQKPHQPKHRVFLLGAEEQSIAAAAQYCADNFPAWDVAGHHHGYVDDTQSEKVIDQINAVRPDLLLVGMGNPIQEQWLQKHADSLKVPLCIGVGGLFDHWGGNLTRAPLWVRRLGLEWLQILLQQPGKKWRRYILGNPKFLWRILLARKSEHSRADAVVPGT